MYDIIKRDEKNEREVETGMKVIKNFLRSVFFPHPAVILLISFLSAVSLIYSLVMDKPLYPSKTTAYLASAYSVIIIILAIPSMLREMKKQRSESKIQGETTSAEIQFRITIFLYGTFFYNAVYGSFQLFLALSHNSVWYYSIAAYYILLAIMRFSLIRYSNSHVAGEDLVEELQRFRFCGRMIIFLTAALAGVTFYRTIDNHEILHSGATSVALAIFTICSFTFSIVNVFRYKKYNSPLLYAAKLISFASALASMLSLGTAVLGHFADRLSDTAYQRLNSINAYTVLGIIAFMGIFMLKKSGEELKKLSASENNERTDGEI